MDIRTNLSRLRAMLERRLGCDLTDYTFWLQNAKMLENHKTLVEQCIRGEGVVQVNIQIRTAERKINILDVLKPDEELVQLPNQMDDDLLEFEEPLGASSRTEEIVEPVSHAAAVKWVVDAQFKSEHRVRVPDDPAEWLVLFLFVYKFVCDLRQLLGYGAGELAELVKEVHDTEIQNGNTNYSDKYRMYDLDDSSLHSERK
ncbi:hypothetical protein HF086_014619 [Spodoptera exigua]|uniref:GA-binding protein alpha subunit N-terminal domain-containing protein n=1 Tax=Spodoptera exigua TaxID=7107 RepID=A0A922M6J2_SPOEX|nr:hypothetical protein HF086_014619 [Spodoptera exigua]